MMNKNFTRLTAILLFVAGATGTVSAQYLKVGTDPFGLNSSAALQIDTYPGVPATGKISRGFLPPRMTTAQRTSTSGPMASPVEGLVVYDTDLNALMVYSGSPLSWKTTSAIGVTKYKKVDGVVSPAVNYPVASDDYTVLGNANLAALTLTLPALPTKPADSGRILVVGKSDFSTNTVTFSPALKLLVGGTTVDVTALDYPKTFRIQSNTSGWYIIGF